MKIPIENSIKHFWLISPILFAALVWVVGCATPNPLAGWKIYFHEPNQIITNDYKDYIEKLPPEEKNMPAGFNTLKMALGKSLSNLKDLSMGPRGNIS